jgi:hypothetical protein
MELRGIIVLSDNRLRGPNHCLSTSPPTISIRHFEGTQHMKDTHRIHPVPPAKKRIWIYVIPGTLALGFIIVSLISYYYSNTGFFTMTLDPSFETSRGISISESMEEGAHATALMVQSVVRAEGSTYASIAFDPILESEGLLEGPERAYMSYAFVIRNIGTATVFVDYYMRLTAVTNRMDDTIRILVIEDDTTYTIYRKEDETPDEDFPSGTFFKTETVAFRDTIVELKPNHTKAFKVVIWTDQDDVDMTDPVKKGTISLQMVFNIAGTETGGHIPDVQRLWIDNLGTNTIDFHISHEEDENA